MLHLLPPSTAIHGILPVQFMPSLVYLLVTSTSYSIHFFTQSLSSFRSKCPNHHNLFCCSIEIMSSNPSLSLDSLLGTLIFYLNSSHPPDHSHLCPLNCHLTVFSYRPGLSILLHTQLLYNLPLTINDISLLVSNGTNYLNLFHQYLSIIGN